MNRIPNKRQIERFPYYYHYLLTLKNSGENKVTSKKIAIAMNYSEEQVRKDLQLLPNSKGKAGCSRDIDILISDLKSILKYDEITNAIVVGSGRFGQLFLSYNGFVDYGINIICGFDNDDRLIGSFINNKPVYSMYDLRTIIDSNNIKIAILNVPNEHAQEITNRLINLGIKGIWNSSEVILKVPDDVYVETISLSVRLATLNYKIKKEI